MTKVLGSIEPIPPNPPSVNQSWPSGPAAIPSGPETAIGSGNSVTARVAGLSIPILLASATSVNQTLPSGPPAMPKSDEPAGRLTSTKAWLTGSIEPILLTACSMNQSRPSVPVAICPGSAFGVGTGNSETT